MAQGNFAEFAPIEARVPVRDFFSARSAINRPISIACKSGPAIRGIGIVFDVLVPLSGRAKRRFDGNFEDPSALGDDFLLGEIQDEQAPAVEEKERKGEWIKKTHHLLV